MNPHPEKWLYPTARGLFCEPGNFYIDPVSSVDRAVITHGHADHARPGHRLAIATPETVDIMKARMGPGAIEEHNALDLGDSVQLGDVQVSLAPAGHVLGSAQVVMEFAGVRAVVSGDYKRRADPTCKPFEVVPCDLFVTEATFGLPVFRHEPDKQEIERLIASINSNPERAHVIGAYGLGKCQRVIKLLRNAGYTAPIWLHGALVAMCELYQRHGIDLGELALVKDRDKADLKGQVVLAPPSALQDRWSRRLPDPITVFASGWMRVRGRARQRGVEFPLVMSDHADWPELIQTIIDTGAREIWVTHGREDALVHQINAMGLVGRTLALVGREDEDE